MRTKSKELKQPKSYGLYPTQIKYISKSWKRRGFRSESAMVQFLIDQDKEAQKKAKVSNEAITLATA